MRLWHLSPSVNSIFKHACTAIHWGYTSDFWSDPSSTSILYVCKQWRLWRNCADVNVHSPEPSLFAYAISTIISSWRISWSKFSQVVFGNWDGPLILPNLWQIQILTSNLQAKHGILTYSPCRAQTCMATTISDQEIRSQGCSQLTHNSNLHAYYQGCLRCKHNTCCKRKLIGCMVFYSPSTHFRSFRAQSINLATLFLGKPPRLFIRT